MAITAYCGVPGSGKTYEVVTEVILPALRSKRRVVSNVAGLHFEEMRAFLIEDGVNASDIGEVMTVDNERVGADGFFYEQGRENTVVKPGDLVVIDECWRWFGVGQKISPAHFAFFREHRHYTDADGVSCDVVLISQSMQDIDRKARVVVEKHFRMEKLKRLGLTKQYTVDVFNGYRMGNNQCVRTFFRKYNPKYFPFYSSYEGKGGDEREVDGRINALRSPLVVLGIPLGVLFLIGGVWGLYHLWFGKAGKHDDAKQVEAPKAAEGAKPAALGNAGVHSDWRAVGFYSKDGKIVSVLDFGGRYRYYRSPEAYWASGVDFQTFVEGKLVTPYTGTVPGDKQSILGR